MTGAEIRTKICGIMRAGDALVAAEAGVDFLGLVFVPERRRRLEIGEAADIVASLRSTVSRPPRFVGLFADQPVHEVVETIKSCGLDLAQLCGKESPAFCKEVSETTGAEIIKVLHISPSESVGNGSDEGGIPARLAPYLEDGCRVTLDRLVEGLQGGTGQSFNWDVASRLSRQGYEFLLAGGLTPENVAEAVALVHPWGVDVSTGVETDGHKDAEKERAFINNARGISS